MTRKCLWLTDLHVDKLSRADQQQLLQAIVRIKQHLFCKFDSTSVRFTLY